MARRHRRIFRSHREVLKALLLQCLLACGARTADATSASSPLASDAGSPDTVLIGEGGGSAASHGGVDLYLDVTLNVVHKGVAHFDEIDGQIWAPQAILRQLGVVVPEGAPDPMRLKDLQGLRADYNAANQTLTLVAPLNLLHVATTVLSPAANKPLAAATASPGLMLNYNVYGTYGEHGTDSLNAFTELRAFNRYGVLSTTELMQTSVAEDGDRSNHSVRLDSSWSMSFPDDLLTVRLGDTLTDALSWSRATRIGGLQVGTNFALQPYLVTAPLPSFIGSATLPSDVELYVNGLRQYSGQVPAGPFQLSTLPNINGAGNAQVVLTNALGQTTTLNFSLYGEHQLLQQGLSDWSAEAGFVRENYGETSFDYGHDPVASAIWRYGLTNNFTIEGHAEASQGLANAGVGGDWLLGTTGGVLSASVAHSRDQGQTGEQYGLGYNWSDNRFNFGVNATRAAGYYRDIATRYGSTMPRLSGQATVSYNFDRLGNVGVSYIDLRYPQQSATRYANAYWYKSMSSSLSLNFSVNQDLDNRSNRSLFLMATLTLDHHTTVSGGIQRDGTRSEFAVNAVQAMPSQGGLGWRASLSQGDGQSGGQGELDYLGRYGQVQAGLYDVGGSRYGYASAIGSVVFMGGGVFASRQINDGFAVVSTDGIAGVPVSLQNNPVGSTDSRGLLLVTPLNAYQNNKLGIDTLGLPPDLRIAQVNAVATPSDRAGTLVRFAIEPVRAASVILVDGRGRPLPLGSQVRLPDQLDGPAFVGFDGAVYLEKLRARNLLQVETPEGSCTAAFDYQKQGRDVPQIGPVVCRKESP